MYFTHNMINLIINIINIHVYNFNLQDFQMNHFHLLLDAYYQLYHFKINLETNM
jgi:hypothetical protein